MEQEQEQGTPKSTFSCCCYLSGLRDSKADADMVDDREGKEKEEVDLGPTIFTPKTHPVQRMIMIVKIHQLFDVRIMSYVVVRSCSNVKVQKCTFKINSGRPRHTYYADSNLTSGAYKESRNSFKYRISLSLLY